MKPCPICGERLRDAYQKLYGREARYVVFCVNAKCDGRKQMEVGVGATVEEAAEDFVRSAGELVRE